MAKSYWFDAENELISTQYRFILVQKTQYKKQK